MALDYIAKSKLMYTTRYPLFVKEKQPHIEPFVVAEHLEYLKDWKSYTIPYLCTNRFLGTSQPHEFCFCMDDNISKVQYKCMQGH